MRVLKLFLMAALLLPGCTPRAPVTVEGAWQALEKAVRTGDPVLMEKILASPDREKIEEAVSLVRSLPRERITSLARTYGMKPEGLSNLNVQEYLERFILPQSERILAAFLDGKVVSLHKEERRAILTLDSGVRVFFRKEGPYWKVHLPGLSERDVFLDGTGQEGHLSP
jgi:hypothetical protein